MQQTSKWRTLLPYLQQETLLVHNSVIINSSAITVLQGISSGSRNVGRIKPLRQQNFLTTTPSWVTELVSAVSNFVLQDSAKSEIYAGNAFFGK